MVLYSQIILSAFFWPFTVQAKAPDYGEPPALERTTGYWATVERVVDGDTIWADGVKYRLIDIDAPEVSSDRRHGFKCEAERRLGELATLEVESLIHGRKVWIKPSGKHDRYGRPLVSVRFGNNKWLGEHLIRQRLAVRWDGRKHAWCAKLRDE